MIDLTTKTCPDCLTEYDSAWRHACHAANGAAESFPESPLGTVLDRKYRIEEKLGEGGMGSVFRARRLFMDDFVAIKFMRPEVLSDAEVRRRFYQEAQAAARIKHPNVVTVHDFGETPAGVLYMVMELLQGGSLGQRLQKNGPLEVNHVLDIGLQICQALTCMHESNVIHRDLKPDNIMLIGDHNAGEMVKVVDFGVAKILESSLRLTRLRDRVGSPEYSSPQQCLGQEVDCRTDLYSLGVVFYECLCGRVPFEALRETDLLAAIVHKMPPRLDEKIPGFPGLVADLVHWLLAKKPEERPFSAAEVAKCLQSLRYGKVTLQVYPEGDAKATVAAAPPTSPAALAPPVTAATEVPAAGRAKTAPRRTRLQQPGAASKPGSPKSLSGTVIYTPKEIWPPPRRKRRQERSWRRPRRAMSLAVFVLTVLLSDGALKVSATRKPGGSALAVLKPRPAREAFEEKRIATPAVSTPANSSTAAAAARERPLNLERREELSDKIILASREARDAVPLASAKRLPNLGWWRGSRPRSFRDDPLMEIRSALPAGMVAVPGASYKQGDVFGDGSTNEKPAHWVRVEGYFISPYEVTNKEYLAFVNETGTHLPEWMQPGSKYHFKTGKDDLYRRLGVALDDPTHPVVGVSWDDAVAFCEWLSSKSSQRYRLPTEAEWELAARGGSRPSRYSWGDGAPKLALGGNVGDESLKQILPEWPIIWRAYNDAFAYTAPVGRYGANGLGIYDMSGNVWEWCSDWYKDDYYQLKVLSNPQGPAQGSKRSIRGGSWSDTPAKVRISQRMGMQPSFQSNNLGFRVVATLR